MPNLQIGTESSDLKAMIRGVGSDNLEAFSDPGVAVHIDGVYQARPSGGNYLYYDMEARGSFAWSSGHSLWAKCKWRGY